MNIQQSPASLSLLGNMLHLVVSSDADVTMTLNLADELLVAHTYSPDSNGLIDVDLHDICAAHLTLTLQNATQPYRQDRIVRQFNGTLVCGEQTRQFGFTVIRAGVDQLAVAPSTFLMQNFLTWQPTVKPVTYYTPEFLTYYAQTPCTVKCTAYNADGEGALFTLGSLSAGGCHTIPTGYAIIAGLANFLPSYYDVWIENLNGNRLTYIQRYYASDIKSEEEEWVLFENSLGGIDTFRAYGDSENTAEHNHHVAEIEEENVEYRVDTERKHKKSTGLLGKYERLWLLDFFPSRGKYIYTGQSIRRIVVTDSEVSYNAKVLPSEYTFTYKYAETSPYLNIPRADVNLQDLHIEVPDIGSFTIAPRLAEFPSLELSDGALFPIQDPYSESWGVTTLASILQYLLGNLDFGGKYLSKVNDDAADGVITFLKGLLVGNGEYGINKDGAARLFSAVFKDTISSEGASRGFMNGSGIIMDAIKGIIQTDGLEVLGWMRIAKLIYNMIQIMEQDYQFSGGGDIERVEVNNDGTFTLYFHKEKEGRHISFADFDILYGKMDEQPEPGGAYLYWTSWMRICENGITLNEGMTPDTARVELWDDIMVPGGRNFAPKGMMTVARRGNTQDTTRQSFWELSTTDERITYYWHLDQPKLRADNYALCLGILPTILDDAGVLPDTRDPRMPSLYVNTIFYEHMHHIYYPSTVVKVDRGEWTANPTAEYTGVDGSWQDVDYAQGQTISEPYHFESFSRNMWLTHRLSPTTGSLTDEELLAKMRKEWHVDLETSRVWRYGALWECLVDETTQAPELGCSDWTLIQQPAIQLLITATKRMLRTSDFDTAAKVATTLGFQLLFGGYDMTGDILTNEAVWTRQSKGAGTDQALADADAAWNQQHRYGNLTLAVTRDDLPSNFRTAREVQFTLTVTKGNTPLGTRHFTLH